MKKILKLMMWVMLLGLPVVMTSCDGLVTAISDNPISPGLKVTTPSIQVEKGKTFKCNAKASSRTNLVYASADPSIATVDSYGVITGVAEGKTTITITTEGKDSQAKSIFTIESVTIPVEVIKLDVPVKSVKLDKTTLTATLGDDPVKLVATVNPDNADFKTVEWTTSDETVVEVEDGVVTFVGAGTATITATATNGTTDAADDKTAKCEVTVNGISVTSVTLEPATLTPTIGDAAVTLTATVAPDNATNKTVTWKSSDETVATVDDNGKVTFVGLGTATITCTATNGTEDTDDDKTATCPVTVNRINVTSVTLEPATLTPTIGDAAVTLTATVAPDNATNKTVTWKSSDETVATVDDNGKVTFVAVGTATITCTATNGTEETTDDKEKTCPVTVSYQLLSAATTTDVGKVVCAAGHLHTAKTAVPTGCTAVGILGKVMQTGHGLILALQDATPQMKSTFSGSGWRTMTLNRENIHLKNLPDAAALGSLTSYTTLGSIAVNDWSMTTQKTYSQIFTNLGSTTDGTYKNYDDNVNDYITNGVGGTGLVGTYWAIDMCFNGTSWEDASETCQYNIRPILSF